MKAVILAGGYGTRLAEETSLRPKPMVEIGGMPILWHIMKIYSAHGIRDFIICLGYKGYVIKEYFANYYLHMSDVTFDLANNDVKIHQNLAEPWHVTMVETGDNTMTGGRLKSVRPYLDDEEFCFTYGDGVANIDLTDLIRWHRQHGCLATVTAIRPPGRFGALTLDNDNVTAFDEKPKGDGSWINGGFFVLSPKTIDLIAGSDTVWENEPLRKLAQDGDLKAYRHEGFWCAMDTLRDKKHLEMLWSSGAAPWRIW